MNLRSPPPDAQRLCDELHASERLRRHLLLVHDVAATLLDALHVAFPSLVIEADVVLFGAATHDLGKVLHQDELVGPGHRHEEAGPALLEQHGVDPMLARFARTHATWRNENVELDDLLVALSDNLWKGKRNEELEGLVVAKISEATTEPQWSVFEKLDHRFEVIAEGAERRLAWQAQVLS
jgi:hypothetical protein